MFLSYYALDFPHPTDQDLRILYSARTMAQVVLDRNTLAALKGGEEVAGCEPLAQCGLLVPDLRAERADVLSYVEAVNSENKHLAVAVIVGMACNFNCTYCYEGERKGGFTMNAATIAQLVPFILKQCRPGFERVSINFYGGEPLLYPEIIKEISTAMASACKDAGLSYDFGLVTNGSLLRPELVEDLKKYGLKAAQITLDGPAVSHNKSRPLKNGGGTFATIVNNIKACAGLIKINVGGNFSKDNYQEFPKLFAELSEAGLGPAQLGELFFSPVLAPEEKKGPMAVHGGCSACSEKWLAPAVLELRAKLMAHGYHQEPLQPVVCMVERDNAFTIHYDGSLCQCPAMVGHGELICGDIWQGFADYREQYNVGHWQRQEECRACKYLLLCFGGCRFMTLTHGAGMAIDCKKSYLDASLKGLVQQDIFYS
ncbi:MAG: geopeptide radical SAM maturase [Thermodesulfobacteriota bacterium]